MSRKRRPPPPPRSLLARWTTQRLALAGFSFGLAAMLVAAFAESRTMLLVYASLLAITLLCGVSILLILLRDVHARQRGDRVRPIRVFDLSIGTMLVLLPGFGLYRIWWLLGL